MSPGFAYARGRQAAARNARMAGPALPFALPSAGNARTITEWTNAPGDVKPSTHDTAQWHAAVFTSYGGGCFVPAFSAAGAFVIAGTGGHNGPPNFGALVADFSTVTWSRIDNANNMAWQVADIGSTEVNAEQEITIVGVTGNMPAPYHSYGHLVGTSDGSKGSAVIVHTQGQNNTGGGGNDRAYRFDLASGEWTRFTSNSMADVVTSGSWNSTDGLSVVDPTDNRAYFLPFAASSISELAWVNLATGVWADASLGGFPSTWDTRCIAVDASRRLLIMSDNNGNLWAVELTNIGAGFQALTKSGTQPTFRSRMAYYPAEDAFYAYGGTGTALTKLKPPATNPLTNSWTWSTVTPSGDSLTAFIGGTDPAHYTNLFYLPAGECLIWVPGGANKPQAIKPS